MITIDGSPRWHDGSPRVFVHVFTGFLDAGHATEHAAQVLLGENPRLLATFDPDALLDYRSRRPPLTYETDHFSSVAWPRLAIYEVLDRSGRPFCVLTGPEPDYRWGSFIEAIIELVDDWGVDLSVGLSGVPWPTPHTRPLGVTVHGSDPRLLPDEVSLLGTLEVPGHVGGVLELRLGQTGHDSVGIAAHVPHYLAQVDFPRAAITMLEQLGPTAGLDIATDSLVPAAERAEAEIAVSVEQSEEFSGLLEALEAQYDQARAVREDTGTQLPSGDEIAAQVEQFLAQMDQPGEEES